VCVCVDGMVALSSPTTLYPHVSSSSPSLPLQ
jgi:hypothetical protein